MFQSELMQNELIQKSKRWFYHFWKWCIAIACHIFCKNGWFLMEHPCISSEKTDRQDNKAIYCFKIQNSSSNLKKCSSDTSLCIYVQLTWAENALRWYVWYRFACFQISKNKFLSDVYKFTYENLKTTLCSWLEKLFCHNVRMGFRSGISSTKVHGFLIIDFPRFESKIFSQKSQECPKIEI